MNEELIFLDAVLLYVRGFNPTYFDEYSPDVSSQSETKVDFVICPGSVEDRRYLRHDILSDNCDFSVIVTT